MTEAATAVKLPSIPGPKVMLLGATGSGKTHAIRTLVQAGKEVFVLFTEPGMEGLSDLPASQCHWKYIAPAAPDWAEMIDAARKINTLDFKALANMGDMNKRKYTEFMDILRCLSDFECDRTGQKYGAVDTWDHDRVLVVDSLSGINVAAMNLVTGAKPVKAMADWGVAMDMVERFISKLTTNLLCPAVVIAHAERETDEVTGGVQVMASTLGRKLAPKLPRTFSDVIYTQRKGDKFSWATSATNVDTKSRNLPMSGDLPPDFRPLLANWEKRLKAGQAAA